MSSTSSVAAMENTPSLNASIREELSDRGISAIIARSGAASLTCASVLSADPSPDE